MVLEALTALLLLALALVLSASIVGSAVRGIERAGDSLSGQLEQRREVIR